MFRSPKSHHQKRLRSGRTTYPSLLLCLASARSHGPQLAPHPTATSAAWVKMMWRRKAALLLAATVALLLLWYSRDPSLYISPSPRQFGTQPASHLSPPSPAHSRPKLDHGPQAGAPDDAKAIEPQSLAPWTEPEHQPDKPGASSGSPESPSDAEPASFWRTVPFQYPVSNLRPLPSGPAKMPLGKIQADLASESEDERAERINRQAVIKQAFLRCWRTYKEHAWLRDEVTPVTAQPKDTLGGWGATLIDSLDTLWIMGLKQEFEEAVAAVDRHIFFNATEFQQINVFETTIRFLGGLLAAYDLSLDKRLLAKSVEVGEMLYRAFDTPNHLPVTRLDFRAAAQGEKQAAFSATLLAEIGSLSLEFARLSFITGDAKFYDAIQHVSELLNRTQPQTKLPGLWPVLVDAREGDFDAGQDYTLGGMADSTYEYLPKMLALLGDGQSIYRDMYTRSVDAVEKHLLFRPMSPQNKLLLFPGLVHAWPDDNKTIQVKLETAMGHLSCFTGGMLALGGRLLSNQHHVHLGSQLTDGCVWAYESFETGVMPETVELAACPGTGPCPWREEAWTSAVRERHAKPGKKVDPSSIIQEQRLPPGFTKIRDPRYMLRPEAIESVFYLYRVSGERHWADKAWQMWEAIDRLTRTDLANTAVWDVHLGIGDDPGTMDSMESFWMGETLKYLYMIFSDPSQLSLDEWVFNTEAHPLRRQTYGRANAKRTADQTC